MCFHRTNHTVLRLSGLFPSGNFRETLIEEDLERTQQGDAAKEKHSFT